MSQRKAATLVSLLAIAALTIGVFRSSRRSRTADALACEDCNLIVISMTNVRRDRIGLYGGTAGVSPTIDAYFRDGVHFADAFAPASWTLPVAASLFTGVFPLRHGLMGRSPARPMPAGLDSLAELLAGAGYVTAAFTGSGDYHRRYGLSRGFGLYVDGANYRDFDVPSSTYGRYRQVEFGPAGSLIAAARSWIAANASKKLFVFLQGYDAHCPFEPAEPHRSQAIGNLTSAIDFSECLWTAGPVSPVTRDGVRLWPVLRRRSTAVGEGNSSTQFDEVLLSETDVEYMRRLYDAKIAELDAALLPFFATLDDLDLTRHSIVVFMSEHGDLLGEHGRFWRGGALSGTFYDEVLSVPFLIRHPNVAHRVVASEALQIVDVMPSWLEWVGVRDHQHALRDGVAFTSSAFGDSPGRHEAFAATAFQPSSEEPSMFELKPTTLAAIKSGQWKLIRETSGPVTRDELYDLSADPGENEDRHLIEPEQRAALAARLEEWLEQLDRRGRPGTTP
jgi:arylsulfatase A-like enzyme